MKIQTPSNLNKDKVDRKDPCLCGSGKKYKKCCSLDFENFEDEDSLDHTDSLPMITDTVTKKYNGKSLMIETSEELGLNKMSELLLEFAEELLEGAKNVREKEGIIIMAVVAWNIAIVADEDRESALDLIEDYLSTLGFKKKSEDKEVVACVLLALVEKKWMEFSEVQHLIIDFEVIETKNEFRLNVASLVAPANKSEFVLPKGSKKVKS